MNSAPLTALGEVVITSPFTSDSRPFIINGTNNINGAGFELEGNGSTTPNKFFRAFNGVLQVLNSNYSAALLSLDDGGNLAISGGATIKALTTAGLVTTTSGGGLGSETGITPAQCPAATTSVQGCVEPDGTTIQIVGGKLTAVGASSSGIDAGGLTSIANGTNGGILFDLGGKVSSTPAPVTGDIVVGGGASGPQDSLVALSSLAPLASPALTGSPTAPTQTAGDNSTKLATDAFVFANSANVYSSGGTLQNGGHVVVGTTNANASGAVVNFSGNATFTSSSTYHCTFASENGSGANNTSAYVSYAKNSGSQFTVYFSATVSSVGYVCVGW